MIRSVSFLFVLLCVASCSAQDAKPVVAESKPTSRPLRELAQSMTELRSAALLHKSAQKIRTEKLVALDEERAGYLGDQMKQRVFQQMKEIVEEDERNAADRDAAIDGYNAALAEWRAYGAEAIADWFRREGTAMPSAPNWRTVSLKPYLAEVEQFKRWRCTQVFPTIVGYVGPTAELPSALRVTFNVVDVFGETLPTVTSTSTTWESSEAERQTARRGVREPTWIYLLGFGEYAENVVAGAGKIPPTGHCVVRAAREVK